MLRKVLVSVALLGMGMAFTAQAEEIEATKAATKDFGTILTPEFGKLDYRYYMTNIYTGDDLTEYKPTHQVRATLGFKLLNKIDTVVLLAGSRKKDTQKLTNRQPQVIASIPVVSGDSFTMGVYADSFLPVAGKVNSTEVGISPAFNQTFSSEWAFSLESEFDIGFSNDEDAEVDNANLARDLTLAPTADESEKYEGVKKDPTYEADVTALVKYTPSFADSKLTIATGIEVVDTWAPTYSANEQGVVENTYEETMHTFNRLKVDYKATENLTLTNDFYHQHEGFYEKRLNGGGIAGLGRVMNRVGLSYSLF